MARPNKTGLDYFSFDVDFFDNKKIRKVMRGGGPTSALILTSLLCNIYSNKGYYTLVDDDLTFDIADKIGVSEGAVKETIVKAVQVDFFDPNQYHENGILTSPEILARYKAGTSKRELVDIDERFTVYSDRNQVNDAGNGVKVPGNSQSKVKETKVNKSKVKKIPNGIPGAAAPGPSKKEFFQLLESIKESDLATVWTSIKNFIEEKKPQFIDPYCQIWNLFAAKYNLSKVEAINESRVKKFNTRIKEETFDFFRILENIRSSDHLKGTNHSWKVTFDWIFENDKNYLKIIEGAYKN